MNSTEDKDSVLATNAEGQHDPFEDFPKCSNVFLKKLKEVFDIRKIIKHNPDVNYLKGVQEVLDFIEWRNNKGNE